MRLIGRGGRTYLRCLPLPTMWHITRMRPFVLLALTACSTETGSTPALSAPDGSPGTLEASAGYDARADTGTDATASYSGAAETGTGGRSDSGAAETGTGGRSDSGAADAGPTGPVYPRPGGPQGPGVLPPAVANVAYLGKLAYDDPRIERDLGFSGVVNGQIVWTFG